MEVATLKDINKGKRCFVIGNGKSLNAYPMGIFLDEITFGVNLLGKMYNETLWRPTYFTLVTDGLWIQEYRRHYIRAVNEAVISFVSDDHWTSFGDKKNICYLQCHKAGDYKASEAQDDWWSDNPSEWVSRWGTSSLVNLQMATYMGHDPIYVVGMDLGFRPFGTDGKDPNHFSPEYGGQFQATRDYDYEECNAAHRRAHEICYVNTQRLGVRVLNATVGGELDVYPRVDLLEVLSAGT